MFKVIYMILIIYSFNNILTILIFRSMNLLKLSDVTHDKISSVEFLQQHGIIHINRMCTNNHYYYSILS